MLMKDDKKKLATVIVAKIGNKDKESRMPESEGAEMSEPDDMDFMADEIMQAFEKKDVKMLKEALMAFVSAADDYEDSQEESED